MARFIQSKLHIILPILAFLLAGQVYGQDKSLDFAGREWEIKKRTSPSGPGGNLFSDSQDSVQVKNGNLHLKIRQINVNGEDKWHSAQANLLEPLGYGTYQFELASNVEAFNEHVVLGLFVYQNDTNEVDIEFTRWGDPTTVEVGQYVTQPGDRSGNKEKFETNLSGTDPVSSTHQFTWTEDSITFLSHHGTIDSSGALIHEWEYTGDDIPSADPPAPDSPATARINLWLFRAEPPSDGQETEVVISDFQFTPIPEPSTALVLGILVTTVIQSRRFRRMRTP